MYIKHKVVMLPTNKKASIGLYPNSNELVIIHDNLASIPNYQHLYILSEDKIKEDNWFLMNGCIIRKCKSINIEPHTIPTIIDTINGIHHRFGCNKIIATTDNSLNIHWNNQDHISLPQLSQSFIEHFVSEYNKGNIITEVMVEYEAMNTTIVNRTYNDFEPRIYPDNTINIKPIKDSWNREEVHNLMMQAWIHGQSKPDCHYSVREKFIEENLNI